MRILFIHKAELTFRPPVISAVLILSDLGHEVHLVTEGVTPYWRNELSRRHIGLHVVPNPWRGRWGAVGKVLAYRRFRREAFKVAQQLFPQGREGLLWVEGAYTVVALGRQVQRYPYVLQIQELHEESRLQLKAIGRVIHGAQCVFMPEYTRCVLYQCWYKLKRRPTVLPNKPYFLASVDKERLMEKYRALTARLDLSKPIILYQGGMSRDRDLSGFVKAVYDMGPDYQLLLVGREDHVMDGYRRLNPRLIHFDYIPAPDYLLFTTLASIGIVSYDGDVLNNAFCAPNKIYEYAAYGLPVVGNDIPGLRNTVAYCGFGKVVDEHDSAAIAQAIGDILADLPHYRERARAFYAGTDNIRTIREALAGISLSGSAEREMPFPSASPSPSNPEKL